MSSVSLSAILSSLTGPQKVSLGRFVPGVRRPAYPDINPRTAAALWSKGLIKGEITRGSRLFILTDLGEQVQLVEYGGSNAR
jgi:hypothetical protein